MPLRATERVSQTLWLAALTLVYAAVALVFATHCRPIIDEGIYLWAGRLVADGRLPYRDFPFSQAPMLPYVLAPAPVWFGSALLGGRAIASACGVLGMAGAFWLAHRLAGPFAAVVTLLVTCATLPILAVSNTVRAQALGTPLLVLGVASLALRPRSAWGWSVAPSLLLWSSGLRLTNVSVLALVSLWVAWRLRRAPAQLARVAGLLTVQALLIGLPVLCAPRDAFFHIVTSQLTRSERLVYTPSPSLPVMLASEFAEYLGEVPEATALVALACALVVRGAWRWWRGWRPNLSAPMGDPATAQLSLALLGAVAFVPHLGLGSGFIEYLIPLWALLAPAVGIGVATELEGRGRGVRWAVAVALFGFVCANASRSQGLWIGTGNESFAAFRRVAAELGRLAGPRCTMLTFETELAVEAGCGVVPGLEYSYFGYFAELPTQEARSRGVSNLVLLRQRVEESRPELIALRNEHVYRLLGPTGWQESRDPEKYPLDFLGPLARHYEWYGRAWIPTSIGNPDGRGLQPILIFRRMTTSEPQSPTRRRARSETSSDPSAS